MTQAEKYRAKATELALKAKRVPALQTEYATMAASYIRLAAQAERNDEQEAERLQLSGDAG